MAVETRTLPVCTQTGETRGVWKCEAPDREKCKDNKYCDFRKVRKEGNKKEIKNAEKNDRIKMMTKIIT